jgi:hypothetical protein
MEATGRTGYASRTYRASTWGRVAAWARTGGFRTVELNPAGWAALLVPGAVVGAGAALARGAPVASGAAAGSLAAWAAGLVADGVRWRRAWVTVYLELSLEETEGLARALRLAGCDAEVVVGLDHAAADPAAGTGATMAPQAWGNAGGPQLGIRYRQGQHRRADAVLRQRLGTTSWPREITY